MELTTLQTRDERPDLPGAPMWIRAVALLGVPSVLSILFAWFITSGLSADVKATREDAATMRAQIQKQATDTEQISRTLMRICINTAKNEGQQSECFR